MVLPPALSQGIEQALEGTPLADLRRAAEALSRGYREDRPGRAHLAGDMAVKAYLATRLPATYAAVRASLAAAEDRMPGFAPKTLLDVGAGPGTALWAAADCWPSLDAALLGEASPLARGWGERLADPAPVARLAWRSGDLVRGIEAAGPHDLVTFTYVLGEIAPERRGAAVERLWALTAGLLVIVEPGTPAGWQRVMDAREGLIAAGAQIVGPCPHAKTCPIAAPDWCHFARRVARSRLHRLAKQADVPWEDEKFIYLAVARAPVAAPDARVIAPPHHGHGRVHLKLCRRDAVKKERLVTRREGDAFRIARRADWGDAINWPEH
jgi:ribosomal protein RSM22 (predicted rRNA methylase)